MKDLTERLQKLSNSEFKKYNIVNLVAIKNTEINITIFFCLKFKFPKNKIANKINPNKNNPSFLIHNAALRDNNKKIK